METQQFDEHILDALIHETSALIKIAELKGHAGFVESAKTGMLRVHMYRLITTLQLYKVLPEDLHIKDGALMPHEEVDEDRFSGLANADYYRQKDRLEHL